LLELCSEKLDFRFIDIADIDIHTHLEPAWSCMLLALLATLLSVMPMLILVLYIAYVGSESVIVTFSALIKTSNMRLLNSYLYEFVNSLPVNLTTLILSSVLTEA